MSFVPPLNLPKRKQKGVIKLFGGIVVPFYFTAAAVKEGTPMKFTSTANQIAPLASGEAALCVGLATQETYDESALGQLKGYHFANDTRQRLNGQPIGLLTGKGWALTNYIHASDTPTWGTQAAWASDGLTTSASSGNNLPIVFESNTDPSLILNNPNAKMTRIRFDFPIAPAAS